MVFEYLLCCVIVDIVFWVLGGIDVGLLVIVVEGGLVVMMGEWVLVKDVLVVVLGLLVVDRIVCKLGVEFEGECVVVLELVLEVLYLVKCVDKVCGEG